jgi:hypothetical protein
VNSHSIPTRYEWLSLEPISAGNWLVTDIEEHRLTGDGVIGHIQLFLGIFETLRRNAPLERHFFDSLASAVDSFAPSLDAAELALRSAAA